jgi:hypothetical protein
MDENNCVNCGEGGAVIDDGSGYMVCKSCGTVQEVRMLITQITCTVI